MLALFFCGEFLLHIPCWLKKEIKKKEEKKGEFLLHIPCCLHFYLVFFSYISRAGFIFLSGEFLLHIPCSLFFPSFFMWEVSLTHPLLSLFLSGEFLLHIPALFFFSFFFNYYFYLGNFSYTFHVCFLFLWEVSLTHPVLASFLSGEFLLHIPCWLF